MTMMMKLLTMMMLMMRMLLLLMIFGGTVSEGPRSGEVPAARRAAELIGTSRERNHSTIGRRDQV